MKLMTYTQMGHALADRLLAICPDLQFQLGPNWNDKDALKRSLVFPDAATEQQRAKVLIVLHNFEGLFVQDNQ